MSEEELEIYDLLRKDKLTHDEEKKVKLAAKSLYETLTKKKSELFIVGWQYDAQPKEKVKSEIISVLNDFCHLVIKVTYLHKKLILFMNI